MTVSSRCPDTARAAPKTAFRDVRRPEVYQPATPGGPAHVVAGALQDRAHVTGSVD